ncbi:hypothetical protein ACIRPX_05150 [Streptomyces sp. NPDC101225]|uniref:hypothetical protein n=1 Tax=Streptomyces sp. NPDC101225 TaxID=3366135 RepID=UPI00380E6072
MGSQDQHRAKQPETAAEAREQAAALTAQADEQDREAGQYSSHELREQAGELRTLARDLARQERRTKSQHDHAAVQAVIDERRAARHPGGMGGGDAA